MAPNPALRLGLQTGPLRVAVLAATVEAQDDLARRIGVRSDILLCPRAADAQVALFDARGADAAAVSAALDLPVPVVVLSSDPEIQQRALAAGARGAIDPEANPSGLVAALIAAVSGLTVIDTPPLATDRPRLTPRESQVLDLVSRGFSNRDIASFLEISEHTVKFHVGGLLAKLGAATRAEAVAIAARERLLV
jgi:DNA-binding NarL/FixJ family response regulator